MHSNMRISILAPFVVYEPVEAIKSSYRLRVRILNKEYVPSLADPQTEYYQSFTKTVTAAVRETSFQTASVTLNRRI